MENIFLPKWKPITHIEEGWGVLTPEEKKEVEERVNSLFVGDFIKMKTNPVFYLHIFSFLAQVEVLAIQIPLKFMTRFDEKVNNQLRRQLIDEIVHGLIFTKMAYHLSLPLSQPVPIIEAAEKMCDDIRSIEDEKLALISLNLIAEGWIEEVFKCVRTWGFSDAIFQNILDDEERHVSDAELYSKTGIETLDKKDVLECIRCMEDNLIEALSSSTVIRSLIEVGGLKNYYHLKNSLLSKHKVQLDEIGIKPSEKWLLYEKTSPDVMFNLRERDEFVEEMDSNMTKKYFCKVWESPKDPVISCEFDLPIPRDLDKKDLTCAYIYLVSRLMEQENFKKNIILSNNHKIVKIKTVNLAVRVLVDTEEGKEIGTVNLFDVHRMDISEIKLELTTGIQTLKFWKNERIRFEKNYPTSDDDNRKNREDFNYSIYSLPTIASTVPHAITNIGCFGYSRGKSAMTSLNSSESCLGEEKTIPVWDEFYGTFEPRRVLPVTLTVDHRILSPHDFDVRRAKTMFESTDWKELKSKELDDSFYVEKLGTVMKDLLQKKTFFDKTMTLKNKRKMLETLSLSTF